MDAHSFSVELHTIQEMIVLYCRKNHAGNGNEPEVHADKLAAGHRQYGGQENCRDHYGELSVLDMFCRINRGHIVQDLGIYGFTGEHLLELESVKNIAGEQKGYG